MATRSDIIVQLAAGGFKRVYAHWDGYYEGNGAILQEHYNSQELAEKLVGPGDISSLDQFCDRPAGSTHTVDRRTPGYTSYYGRDRGDKDSEGTVRDTLAEALAIGTEEYRYLWYEGKWYGFGGYTPEGRTIPEGTDPDQIGPETELVGILTRLKVAASVEAV